MKLGTLNNGDDLTKNSDFTQICLKFPPERDMAENVFRTRIKGGRKLGTTLDNSDLCWGNEWVQQ